MSQSSSKKSADRDLDHVTEKYTYRITPQVEKSLHQPEVARQYLPDARELMTTPGEDPDPIGDNAHSPVKGIVHRYPDRVLFKPHHACAVYCRFCFRKDMVGRQGEVLSKQEVEHAISYIRNHPEIWEVILTGGDPMALSSRRLRVLMEDLDQIEHVKSIRFHTRVPIAAPNLINADIISLLSAAKTAITVSVHCNHAAEITSEVTDALRSIRRAGAMLVSQSVLLRGVNDNRDALIGLFKALTENGVKPYYLHHPDKAPGTGHFQLSLREGLDLYQSLRGHISGLCIPQYMLDIPGGYGKVAIDSHNVMIKKNHAEIIDRHGVVHIYNNS